MKYRLISPDLAAIREQFDAERVKGAQCAWQSTSRLRARISIYQSHESQICEQLGLA